MIARILLSAFLSILIAVSAAAAGSAGEHPGRESIEKTGYEGPATCEACHPGKAKEFLKTVHWTHASRVTNVENTDPKQEYGMKNRAYTMCNGNDTVNNLKEVVAEGTGQKKYTGCNACHPGDHVHDIGSTGPGAEGAVDCLLCHASRYDYGRRKPYKDEKGQVVIGQDRSREAAMSVGRPSVKNCMVCHESAGGGTLVKKGFAFTAENDVHAAKGMVCVDCHKAQEHRIPTGLDPNLWANDGLRLTCTTGDCHRGTVHKEAELNRHTARIACQTCHIPRTGGAFAKDFTRWRKVPGGFYEYLMLQREANETVPVYAWYNGTVRNTPRFIGPKGSRRDGKSRIHPFKIFEGKGFFDRKTGRLLSMDFAPPMATGDTKAGLASASRILGPKTYDPVPGWQTIYFGSNHLVRKKALQCHNCHARNGVLNFRELGYNEGEIRKLTHPELYFDKLVTISEEEW